MRTFKTIIIIIIIKIIIIIINSNNNNDDDDDDDNNNFYSALSRCDQKWLKKISYKLKLSTLLNGGKVKNISVLIFKNVA